MTKAIRVHQHGGPEVMVFEDVTVPEPGPGQALIRHTAIGVNFIDTYFRSGLYKSALPLTPGNEGVGVVEAVGDGVTEVAVGDRVGYVDGPASYSEKRLIRADRLIPIPDTVSDETAAAIVMKGLTVQYLVRQTYKLSAEHTVLYHAAAGGVGLVFGQWAKHLRATVIGTAGTDDKLDLARAHGYDHVINYRTEDFVTRALELNHGQRLDVVYDSVGKDTFPASLDVLKPLGLFVTFGQSSGPIPPFDVGILNTKGSLYMTRPSLYAYAATRERLLAMAAEMFDLVARGVISVDIHQRFDLKDARRAHEALEGRQTTGATILIP